MKKDEEKSEDQNIKLFINDSAMVLMISLMITLVIMLISTNSFAYKSNKDGTGKKGTGVDAALAAGCSPPTAKRELAVNNVNCTIGTDGVLWLNQDARYEVPAGSGKHSLYAGSLWLAGQDVSGQLKVAAMDNDGSGNDFWAGPLNTTTAEIDPATCTEYDKHFETSKAEIAMFAAYHACINDPDCDDEVLYPNYQIPEVILNWPAHGRNFPPYNEDYYLAPFYDANEDNMYNPMDGDYPGYDLSKSTECGARRTDLYGDFNLWWVFNDKGSIHSNTNDAAIGMEIRAQAFAFATNDEVNNMTFYNFELINRSSFTLTETYFGIYADADIGGFDDDFVGCDVERGLAYAYNGDNFDASNQGAEGYLDMPPAVGIDFFEGPYQDSDGIANERGIEDGEALNGVGYGDDIIDNERFGMRRFVYFNGSEDPVTGTDYYNYLRGIWAVDGQPMTYGGNGKGGSTLASFMFPDDSDPLGWGTGGAPQSAWSETSAASAPGDRRFIQSAGPFTLTPGAINDITIGVVWAQATTGGAEASVELLKLADEKTQAMFDNCFRVMDGPDAPEILIQEMDQQLVLMLNNSIISNNYQEQYEEIDPFLFPEEWIDVDGDGIVDRVRTEEELLAYRTYKFQGYKVYQVVDETVSPSELNDPGKARLILQCDIEDGVSQIVNFYNDVELGFTVPLEMVYGADKGVTHTLLVSEDQFAVGDKQLVNHKEYCFMAVSYAYNNFQQYNPATPTLQMQDVPYLESRKSATGAIRTYCAIPHLPALEKGGTIINASYGDGVQLTRVEGLGNGGNVMSMTKESLAKVMEGEPWRVANPTYKANEGPISIKVVDPLNVIGGDFTIALVDDGQTSGNLSDDKWTIYQQGTTDTIVSNLAIEIANEQLLLDYGISVEFKQVKAPGSANDPKNGFLEATMTFEDPSKEWLTGVQDQDGPTDFNWIRSGTAREEPLDKYILDHAIDSMEAYENLLNGTWAPYRLASHDVNGPVADSPGESTIYLPMTEENDKSMAYLHDVNVVFTKNKDLWTRCPVVEMQADPTIAVKGAVKGAMRRAPSVDKNGNAYALEDSVVSENDNDANYISATGMGWFPGYAVDIETGERLNMAFGEDSWLKAENGADMIWNPTDRVVEGPFADVRFGGKHYIYVFRNNVVEENQIQAIPHFNKAENRMPMYDYGRFAFEQLNMESTDGYKNVWRSCMWTSLPLLAPNHTLLSTDATVKLRVKVPFQKYGTQVALSEGEELEVGKQYLVRQGPVTHDGSVYDRGDVFAAISPTFQADLDDVSDVLVKVVNSGNPIYNFNTWDLAPTLNENLVLENALKEIKVVPNPYYGFSTYEANKLDNRVKVINLPQRCTINIYTVNGTLVRKFSKDDPTITSIDWNLTNFAGTPIGSGMYIFYINVPGVGEKVVKWFGALRTVDLDSF